MIMLTQFNWLKNITLPMTHLIYCAKIFLLIFALALNSGCQKNHTTAQETTFEFDRITYSLSVVAADKYPAYYYPAQSYLADTQKKPIIQINSQPMLWQNQQQDIDAVSYIKINWFSATENQFWQGEHQLSYDNLYNFRQKKINALKNSPPLKPTELYFDFVIYLMPKGVINVWLVENNQKYILAEFTAEKAPPTELSQYLNHRRDDFRHYGPPNDQKFIIKTPDGIAIPHFKYKIERNDGEIIYGISNARGETVRITTGEDKLTLNLFADD